MARHVLAAPLGRSRAAADRAVRRGRGADLPRRSAGLVLVSRPSDRAHAAAVRHRRAARRVPSRHRGRPGRLVHRHERARRGQRRRVASYPGDPPRRGLAHRGHEDLDLGCGRGRLVLCDRPHRPRCFPARRPVGIHRRHARTRGHGPPDPRHDRRPSLLRGGLRERGGARVATRRPVARGLPPDHAADGTRARRDRPAGVEPPALPRRTGHPYCRTCARSSLRSKPAIASVG